jgi:hypothetical protein
MVRGHCVPNCLFFAVGVDLSQRPSTGEDIMAIETVGTPEVLLQLILAYQGLDGPCPTPTDLWRQIAKFIESSEEPVFRSYRLAGVDPTEPNAQFLGDLVELIKLRWIRLRDDGRLELTAVGRCLAFGRELPPVLQRLGKQVEANARER